MLIMVIKMIMMKEMVIIIRILIYFLNKKRIFKFVVLLKSNYLNVDTSHILPYMTACPYLSPAHV